ncbi:MAG: PAS domain S-box protein [Desulfobaccales bacterium]
MKAKKASESSPQSIRPKAGSKEDGNYPRQWLNILHQRERLFRLVFESADIGISIIDRQGNFLDVNPAIARLLGYSRAEMRKMDFAHITHPADFEKCLNWFHDLMAGKIESYRLDKRFLHRDGRVIWAHVIVSYEKSVAGPPLFAIGLLEDVTQQKEALEALQRSEARYRLLAENISDIIWTKDLRGKITYISPSIQKLTGISAEEAVGMSIDQIVTPASAELYKTKIADQLKLEKLGTMDPSRSWTLEGEMRHKDGSTSWAEWKMTFLRDSRGCPIGTVGVTRDISERKNLEKQLVQAQRLEAVARLAGGMAHDFNNFLMAIMGYSEVISINLPTDDPLQQYARDIMLAAERTSSVTRQLLAFSRRQVFQPQILDLNHSVQEMERMLRRLIREDIELDIVLEPDLGNVRADPGQIEQVIMNLVINAKDALPMGGKIQIRTERVYLDEAFAKVHPDIKAGFYMQLTVADNGIGMDAETLDHIFEPFFSTKEGERGSGLGLATVYGIVKQSGGHITVSSQVGKGSIFSIYLPRVLGAEIPKEIVPSLEMLKGEETILVAEDENILREVICKSLQPYGFKVLEAADGRAALQIAEEFEGPIHLLLADVVMPGMNGIELASRLAKLHPEIKILYMSGHVESALVRHGLLDSVTPFIQKPCRTITLIKKVREFLHSPLATELA